MVTREAVISARAARLLALMAQTVARVLMTAVACREAATVRAEVAAIANWSRLEGQLWQPFRLLIR